MRGAGAALVGVACAAAAPEPAVPPGLVLERVDFDGAGWSGRAASVVLGENGALEAQSVQGTLTDGGGGVWSVRAGGLRGASDGWVAEGGVEASQGSLRVEAAVAEAALGPGHRLVAVVARGGVRVAAPGREGAAETAQWSSATGTVTFRGDAVWRVGPDEQRGDVLVVRLPDGMVCAECPPAVGP